MYVWCDALANYISALGYGRKDDEKFEEFWPANVHVIGKDILRFHAIIWPAMLLSAGIALPERLLVHRFITSGRKKMSKSTGNIIDPKEIISKYGVSALRYYFAREITPFEDSDFTIEKFISVYNANLANGLGNLVSRTTKMAKQYFNGEIAQRLQTDLPLRSRMEGVSGESDIEGFSIPYTISQNILPSYAKHMDEFEINKAADDIWKLVGMLDGYIAIYEPFKLIKNDKDKAENIIWNVCYGLYFISKMLEPLMPETATIIRNLLDVKLSDENIPISFSVATPPKPLFERI